LVAFGPGMRFWHMGQWEGRTKRIPVQITRQPEESCGCLLHELNKSQCQCVEMLYDNLFVLANKDIFKYGKWQRIDLNADAYTGLFLWKWEYQKRKLIIAINYNSEEIKLDKQNPSLSNINFDKSIFPTVSDSYGGTVLSAWDVRIWGG